ncbi:electron transfer flavoprotein [Weissella oryzae SG25]|uniref:Electron transfer flavoprotein n=1 Tax=Weissella oryzae (strain DSM 25784 / JCM 18191 / LMG 30913 / SG25) TaxID=1329250 RepID=A0A069CUF2_WEIOS|nr:electron transfer flavoprotein subunit alpha/FixB family protein [Weissella oryzae]GAK30833.1 electron transfer flavoprotein [Weissella oryzae SG25]
MADKKIWVIGEVLVGKLDNGLGQLITKARQIKNADHKVVAIIPLGDDLKINDYQSAQYFGADEVIYLTSPEAINADDYILSNTLTTLAKTEQPDTILFSATPLARSWAPKLQYNLQTALTADALDFYYEDSLLVQVKPSYGDKILAEIVSPTARPQMATARPGTFEAVTVDEPTKDIRKIKVADLIEPKSQFIESIVTKNVATKQSVTTADLIFAVGRGVKKERSIAKLHEIAHYLGAAVGATRPMAEKPGFDHSDQIGQSGSMVSPKLLINLGISGSMQYVAGIKGAKQVISINTNENAPVFEQSDFVKVGDALSFIDDLHAKLLDK